MDTCVVQSPEVTVHIFYHFQVERERAKPFQTLKNVRIFVLYVFPTQREGYVKYL